MLRQGFRVFSVTGAHEAAVTVVIKLLRGEVSDALYTGPEFLRDVLIRFVRSISWQFLYKR